MDNKLKVDFSSGYGFKEPTAGGWLRDFAMSTVESIPELVGITPSRETIQWRQENPYSGFASELVGMAVPYAGWYTSLAKVPKLQKMSQAIDKLGDAVNHPVGTGFKREVLKIAPFETGRVAASQFVGDESFADMAGGALINTALAGGIGSVLTGIAASGLRTPDLPTIFPGLNLAAPRALQARHMKKLLDEGAINPELLPVANNTYKNFESAARKELPGRYEKYVGGLKDKRLERDLNRWFAPTENVEGRPLQIRMFTRGAKMNFDKPETWLEEIKLAGLPDDFATMGQYFRQIAFNNEKSRMPKVVENKFTRDMNPLGGGWFYTQEADDGLYVMAKKYVGETGKSEPTDKWIMFKTDDPGRLVPEHAQYAKAITDLNKWNPALTIDKDYGVIGNSTKGFMQQVPFVNYKAFQSQGTLEKAIDKLMPRNVAGKQNELFARFRENARGVLLPRMSQFVGNARANWLSAVSKFTSQRTETITNELMNGVVSIEPGKQLFFNTVSNVKGALGLKPIRPSVMDVPEEVFQREYWRIWNEALSTADVEKLYRNGEISEQTWNLVKTLDQTDSFTTSNINLAEEAVGKKKTTWLEGHRGLSRMWEGDTRIFLTNEQGHPVAIAGGPNKRAAQANARALMAENPGWKQGKEVSFSQLAKEETGTGLDLLALTPSFTLERHGLKGYKWGTKPFTREEFLEAYENNLRGRMRYQAQMTRDDLLDTHLSKLADEDPVVFKQLTARMNDDIGVQSEWSKQQNRLADQYLAPILGKDSASKIVGLTNTALVSFHLGMGKLSYPAMNALTFVQTVNPEVAYIMSAPDARKMAHYSIFAAGGSVGPVGAMGVLSPLKLTFQAGKEMARPSKQLTEMFERAMNERILDPRVVEGYIGESATKIGELGKVLKGEASFVSWLRALSEFLPVHSERLSRGHAFTVGYIMARDLLAKGGKKLSDDEIFKHASEFTSRTMYEYGTADRARILTTPMGMGMGLFKNWLFHYMAQMGQYSKEAFVHGNIAPLLWQTAGTAAVGGLAASPLYVPADAFSKLFSGKGVMENAYDNFGEGADGFMYGMPALLTGGAVSLQAQATVPGADPMRDASMLFNSALLDRMRSAGKAFGGAFDHWQATGTHPASDPQVRRELARAFAPVTIYRSMSTMSDGTIVSPSTGYPIVSGQPFHAQILYRLGVNSTEIDRAFYVSNELYQDRAKQKHQVAILGEAFAAAQMKGDSREMGQILRQSMLWGLDSSRVMSSAMTRLSNQHEDMVNRKAKPQELAKFRGVLGQ